MNKKLVLSIIAATLIISCFITIGYRNFSVSRNDDKQSSLEFLQAGGYEEEFYPYFTVEFSGPDGTVILKYEYEHIDTLEISCTHKDGDFINFAVLGELTVANSKIWGIDWSGMSLPEIYEKLKIEFNITTYKVYKTI